MYTRKDRRNILILTNGIKSKLVDPHSLKINTRNSWQECRGELLLKQSDLELTTMETTVEAPFVTALCKCDEDVSIKFVMQLSYCEVKRFLRGKINYSFKTENWAEAIKIFKDLIDEKTPIKV